MTCIKHVNTCKDTDIIITTVQFHKLSTNNRSNLLLSIKVMQGSSPLGHLSSLIFTTSFRSHITGSYKFIIRVRHYTKFPKPLLVKVPQLCPAHIENQVRKLTMLGKTENLCKNKSKNVRVVI